MQDAAKKIGDPNLYPTIDANSTPTNLERYLSSNQKFTKLHNLKTGSYRKLVAEIKKQMERISLADIPKARDKYQKLKKAFDYAIAKNKNNID